MCNEANNHLQKSTRKRLQEAGLATQRSLWGKDMGLGLQSNSYQFADWMVLHSMMTAIRLDSRRSYSGDAHRVLCITA